MSKIKVFVGLVSPETSSPRLEHGHLLTVFLQGFFLSGKQPWSLHLSIMTPV